MSRTLKYDIPGRDFRVSVEELRSQGWEKVFAPDLDPPDELVLEIGFGRGEFLKHLAEASPRSAHLGVEYSKKRVLKMARRLARTEITNVRLVAERAEIAVGELLPDASVAAVWVNFPDPWPKKRHHRRRLLQPSFVSLLAACLRPGGVLHAATDHEQYAEAIHDALAGEPLLENLFAPEPFLPENPGRLATAYELEWRAEGRPFHFFAYRRRAG